MRGWAAVGVLLCAIAAPAAARELDPLELALRRAALELSAGRPAEAALAVNLLAPAPAGGPRGELVALLRAESELLAASPGAAWAGLQPLAAARDGFVRGQAAAHRLGLAMAGFETAPQDSNRTRLQVSLAAWERDHLDDAPLVDLVAARAAMALGDSKAASDWLGRARDGTAAPAAALWQAEGLLRAGDAPRAGRAFEALARTDAATWDGWARAWGEVGMARAQLARGDRAAARARLAAVQGPAALVAEARLWAAQWAHAEGDTAAVRTLLSGLQLDTVNGVLATEMDLLALQAALYRGDFAFAESLATAVRTQLDARCDPSHPTGERWAAIDVRAWHGARAAATLRRLAAQGVLRDMPAPTALPQDAQAVGLVDAAPESARADLFILEPLQMHEAELASAGAWRMAERRFAQSERRSREAQRDRDAAELAWACRRTLVARGRAGLDASRLDLARLESEAARLRAGLAAHVEEIAAAERAWTALLERRLAVLERAVAELRRADTRLHARYPEDRSVRPREPVAAARAGARGTADWVARADSLHAVLHGQVAARVHAVLEDHELAADLARLDTLAALLARVRGQADALALALDAADAAERAALAAADARLQAAQAELAARDGERTLAAQTARTEQQARAGLRRQAYGEAAAWGGASAAFFAACAPAPGDPSRVARLVHAAQALEDFASGFPSSLRHDETLYRLGEVHLQRATLQYEADLAAFLQQGGRADQAPLPVEGYADALQAYRRLVRLHPTSPRAHDARYSMGFLFAETGAVEASAEVLEQFLAAADSTDSRIGRAALRLGDDRLQMNEPQAALAAFRRAAGSSDPESRDLGLFKQGWCAYDLDHHEEARSALRTLLARAGQEKIVQGPAPRAAELAPEALELLALAFAADSDAHAAAAILDSWGRPAYDFQLLRRMADLFASRAQYDDAIAADELLLDRHPHHRALPAVAEDLLRWIEVRQGAAAAHARAARLALQFAPGSEWAQHANDAPGAAELRPRLQSRLMAEDRAVARADSVVEALARPEAAAARMAARLRAAAVYEHRAARADSTHRRGDLQRAVALYEQTLKTFPDAADEPTTHLYLGEARYELGAYTAAADAYGTCAAHARADSTLAHTAAGQELAALDAAAAADPGTALGRYEKTTRRFAARYPGDTRNADAFERIGALAFKAQDWDAAERGYTETARRTPDGKRAAAALKMTGDVAWQRERFDVAAARYDSAWVRARQSHADTLAAALGRLVPAALYRGAEADEKRGDRARAARGFETAATRHPGFEVADRAWFRAAGLHAAQGDSAAAAAGYARVVRGYPQSALRDDAWLEQARCEEGAHDRLHAARTFRDFAAAKPQHAQATPARLRAGLLFAATGHPAAADSQYAIVLHDVHPAAKPPRDAALAADLWMRRARLATTPATALPHYRQALGCGAALPAADRGEALFQVTESARPAYQSVPLRQPIAAALQKKQKAVEPLLAGYAQVAEQNTEPWHAAACLRLGETLADLGHALRTSEPPAGLEGEDLYAYQEVLGKQAGQFEDRAVEAWSRGLAAARVAKHQDAWTRASEARLYPALATRVPTRPAPLFVLVQP